MSSRDPRIGRRDALRALAAIAAAAGASTAPLTRAEGNSENDSKKSKGRYQADSPEVQTFYRVNRYLER